MLPIACSNLTPPLSQGEEGVYGKERWWISVVTLPFRKQEIGKNKSLPLEVDTEGKIECTGMRIFEVVFTDVS